MHKYSFRVFWSDADGAYIATCPEFPGLSAFGATEEKALREAKVALKLFIEDMQEDGEPLPEPQKAHTHSGQTRLRLPKSLHRLAAEMAEEEGESLNQFIIDAVQARVSGRQVAGRILEEVRKEMAQTRTTLASVAMSNQQPATRLTETVKTTREVSTEQTYFIATAGESKKDN